MTSADSYRAREICVSGLLRMSGKSFPLPVWMSVGSWFTGKWELDVWVVRAVT